MGLRGCCSQWNNCQVACCARGAPVLDQGSGSLRGGLSNPLLYWCHPILFLPAPLFLLPKPLQPSRFCSFSALGEGRKGVWLDGRSQRGSETTHKSNIMYPMSGRERRNEGYCGDCGDQRDKGLRDHVDTRIGKKTDSARGWSHDRPSRGQKLPERRVRRGWPWAPLLTEVQAKSGNQQWWLQECVLKGVELKREGFARQFCDSPSAQGAWLHWAPIHSYSSPYICQWLTVLPNSLFFYISLLFIYHWFIYVFIVWFLREQTIFFLIFLIKNKFIIFI